MPRRARQQYARLATIPEDAATDSDHSDESSTMADECKHFAPYAPLLSAAPINSCSCPHTLCHLTAD